MSNSILNENELASVVGGLQLPKSVQMLGAATKYTVCGLAGLCPGSKPERGRVAEEAAYLLGIPEGRSFLGLRGTSTANHNAWLIGNAPDGSARNPYGREYVETMGNIMAQ